MGIPPAITATSSSYDNPLARRGALYPHLSGERLNPLPSFEGEPRRVAITAPDAGTLAKELWDNLNEDNKVSLFVRYIDLATGNVDDRDHQQERLI